MALHYSRIWIRTSERERMRLDTHVLKVLFSHISFFSLDSFYLSNGLTNNIEISMIIILKIFVWWSWTQIGMPLSIVWCEISNVGQTVFEIKFWFMKKTRLYFLFCSAVLDHILECHRVIFTNHPIPSTVYGIIYTGCFQSNISNFKMLFFEYKQTWIIKILI